MTRATAAVAGAFVLALLGGAAVAVHDAGAFEMDRDVADGADAAQDWANVYDGTFTGFNETFLHDEARPDPSHHAAGNKDTLPLSAWGCDVRENPNDKGDILHAYTGVEAGLDGGDGESEEDAYLYFGAERFDGSGAMNFGTWFLQDEVDCDSAGSGTFTGDHSDGDLLVVSEFTNGGAIPNIKVYRWSGGADGTLDTTPVVSGADCVGDSAAGDDACGTVNNATIATPWPTQTKGGNPDELPPGHLFEGGLNVHEALGGLLSLRCYKTVIVETRASASVNSNLLDYGLARIKTCDARITIAPQEATNDVGTTHDFTITVEENVGTGWRPSANDTVTARILSGPGSFVDGIATCTTDGAGTCTVTITSSAAGTTLVEANATATIGQSRLDVVTDGTGESSGPATKHWVLAEATIATTASPGGDDVAPGTPASDSATVTGAEGRPAPTGTVTFFLCAPDEVDDLGCPDGAGAQVGDPVALDGGSATSASTGTTTALGTYCWRAGYSGDDVYAAATHTNRDSECFTVTARGDVSVAKEAENSPVNPGEELAFTLTVTNHGPREAPDVVLEDTLPAMANAWSVGGADGADCALDGLQLTCDFGTLPEGATRSVRVSVVTTSGDGGDVTNIATVTSTGDPNADNDEASATAHVNAADVGVAKEAEASPVNPGDELAFTITATNHGPDAATGVVVEDVLPAMANAWSVGGADGDACAIDDGALTCTFGTVPDGESRSVRVSVTTTSEDVGDVTNTVRVTSDADPDGANDEASATAHVNAADVRITKTADAEEATLGEPIGFEIQVTNLGPDTAENVEVTDSLPDIGAGWSLGGPDAGACGLDGLELTCTWAGLEPDAVRTVRVEGTPARAGEVANTARVTSDADPEPGNDEASAAVQVGKAASETVTEPEHAEITFGEANRDTARVTGVEGEVTPTGTVEFHACGPDELDADGLCSKGGAFVSAEPLDAEGRATSASFTPTSAGTWCFRGAYGGDDNYEPSTDASAAECFTVAKADVVLATTSDPQGGGVLPGAAATDTATITGVEGGASPTGTVTFFLCAPDEVDSEGCPDGAGAQVGDPVEVADGAATSEPTTATLDEGRYCWRAAYSGDGNYASAAHTNNGSECFEVAKLHLSVATTSTPNTDSAGRGTEAYDTATFTHPEDAPAPTGTARFFLCGPDEATDDGCPEGSGAPVGEAVPVAGEVVSATTTDTQALGRYCWRAEYSGDTIYHSASHTNGSTECFTTIPGDLCTEEPGHELCASPYSGESSCAAIAVYARVKPVRFEATVVNGDNALGLDPEVHVHQSPVYANGTGEVGRTHGRASLADADVAPGLVHADTLEVHCDTVTDERVSEACGDVSIQDLIVDLNPLGVPVNLTASLLYERDCSRSDGSGSHRAYFAYAEANVLGAQVPIEVVEHPSPVTVGDGITIAVNEEWVDVEEGCVRHSGNLLRVWVDHLLSMKLPAVEVRVGWVSTIACPDGTPDPATLDPAHPAVPGADALAQPLRSLCDATAFAVHVAPAALRPVAFHAVVAPVNATATPSAGTAYAQANAVGADVLPGLAHARVLDADCQAASAAGGTAATGQAQAADLDVDLTSLGLDVVLHVDALQAQAATAGDGSGGGAANVLSVQGRVLGVEFAHEEPPAEPNSRLPISAGGVELGYLALNEQERLGCAGDRVRALRLVVYVPGSTDTLAEVIVGEVHTRVEVGCDEPAAEPAGGTDAGRAAAPASRERPA